MENSKFADEKKKNERTRWKVLEQLFNVLKF